MTDNPYPVGTTVFAKLKGYPWWPARIESDEDLPLNVSSKKPKQRPIWPVFFFGSYDYGWFGTSELKSFDPVSAEKAKSALKKGSGLRTALSEALDPSLIAQRPGSNAELDQYNDDDEYDQESVTPVKKKASKVKAAQKVETSAAEKKRRPSSTEDQAAKRKVSKKTSIDEDHGELDSPKKRAGPASRIRLESDFKSVDDDISIGDPSNGRSKKSEDDAADSDLRAKKRMRSGQPSERLLKLRHKLQKLLLVEGLSDEVLIQNLDRADPIMAEVEAFDIDLQMLKDTKVGRLMKKISVLQFSEDRHGIVERSVKLIKQYKGMMERAQENGEAVSPRVEKTTETSTLAMESTIISTVVQPTPMEIDTEITTLESVQSETREVQVDTLASSNNDVTDTSAPAPEAVVAAVAAIVETGAFSVARSSESVEPQENGKSTEPDSTIV